MKKSFRGKLASGAQDTIRLSTNNGLTGYNIAKFQILPNEWGAATQEVSVQVFTTELTDAGAVRTPSNVIDFRDPTLLAVACQTYNLSANTAGDTPVVVFDNMTFNQDIFVLAFDADGNAINYYLELEQVKLNANEATVATLKDMRAGPDTNFGP